MHRPLRTAAVTLAVSGTIAALTAPTSQAVAPKPRDLGTRSVSASTTAPDAIAELRGLGSRAKVDGHQSFRATTALKDKDGTTHTRLERTYRGLPVLGGDVVVHQRPDGSAQLSQSLTDAPDVSPTTRVGAATAKSTVGRQLDRGLKLKGKAPRLVVDATTGTDRLAWEVLSGGRHADGTPSRMLTYVDARTGAVIRAAEQIHTADGQGHSLYSGTVPLTTSSGYTLRDDTRGGAVTNDLKNASDSFFCQIFKLGCSNGTAMTDADNIWGNGTTSDRATAAVDAHYGSAKTWDYFKNVHGRNGIWGNGKGAVSRVHYGKNYVNAFWDGTRMSYGDGNGTTFGPLVSLDVTGHEMSHGVTENSAKLNYSGESGGLNEATSDIFGAMVEFSAANSADPGDYLIGEEFDLQKHQGFRRMDKPSSDGKSADCWTTGTKNLDVHYSSGVGNHFFYLLAEGSGDKSIGGVAHSSTTCNGTTITGIGRDAAAKIWYRALTVYMTSSTTYAQAKTATEKAAADLYGAGSVQQQTVTSAWKGVSVG